MKALIIFLKLAVIVVAVKDKRNVKVNIPAVTEKLSDNILTPKATVDTPKDEILNTAQTLSDSPKDDVSKSVKTLSNDSPKEEIPKKTEPEIKNDEPTLINNMENIYPAPLSTHTFAPFDEEDSEYHDIMEKTLPAHDYETTPEKIDIPYIEEKAPEAQAVAEEEDNSLEPKKIAHSLKMPVLGFGTAALGAHGVQSICHALNGGYRLFDSAQAKEWYQEADMGRAIQDCWAVKNLDDILIVTKIHPRSFPYDTMLKDIKASQEYFYGTNRTLDVVLLHAPYCWWHECTDQDRNNSWIDAWKNLEKIQELGLVHAIGVSNFNFPQLEELLEIANKRVSVVQNWMDPFHQDVEVRALCKENKIAYMAYSSLGTQWHERDESNPVFSNHQLQAIAKKHNKSIALVVLSWVIQEGAVAIPRTTNPGHITDNAALLGIGGHQRAKVFLDDNDLKVIRSLDGTNYRVDE